VSSRHSRRSMIYSTKFLLGMRYVSLRLCDNGSLRTTPFRGFAKRKRNHPPFGSISSLFTVAHSLRPFDVPSPVLPFEERLT
jgi:hypothetical protein